ncbi:MAG: sigma 54-interacting transcriptional regulator, partial [Myxococcales bacterium]|nr:sigma 54-interacting transcriptional regulator [Myxococcales bacterium]
MPRVIALPWKTRAKPIDHDKIRPFAEKALEQARRDNPGAHIYLHLSPGTPAMHAVWLVLGSTGFVEGPLTMIQTVREDQRSDKSPIFAVPFEVDTWLRRFRAASPRASSGDDDGKLWEPGAFSEGGRMRATLQQLRAWADLPAPVLLLGERGTGKSTLANFLRAIGPFQRGKKSEGQGWPSVVCGQFRGDPQMARSEIFGHRKGAFTGADRDRPGLLEDADGDSLFLDEIADLDRDVQRLLMAALEGRGFHRLGDETRRSSSFRLICATNRSLSELAGGLLDPDFFDRVAVFTLKVPPLRECGPDLSLFWRKVLVRTAARSGLAVDIEQALSNEILLAGLRKHPLPGNLRDLERVAWHLVAQLHAGMTLSTAIVEALRALEIVRAQETLLPEVEALQSGLPLEQPLSQYLSQLRERWI